MKYTRWYSHSINYIDIVMIHTFFYYSTKFSIESCKSFIIYSNSNSKGEEEEESGKNDVQEQTRCDFLKEIKEKIKWQREISCLLLWWNVLPLYSFLFYVCRNVNIMDKILCHHLHIKHHTAMCEENKMLSICLFSSIVSSLSSASSTSTI